MTRVYIAGPYTLGNPSENVRIALSMADELFMRGFLPFVPHLFHFWDLISPKSYDEWMDMCSDWLETCHCLLRLPGPSRGADEEVDMMRSLNRPVFFNIEDLFTHYKGD